MVDVKNGSECVRPKWITYIANCILLANRIQVLNVQSHANVKESKTPTNQRAAQNPCAIFTKCNYFVNELVYCACYKNES